ncbi:glycosyltransferase family protein [Thiotrichales bacterium 19S11-10]|nr:glycosyltransferase family protein [Thiotrichales bacterium 19S11-10]
MTKRVAIVQARMNSSRLPGKVLKKVNNKPLLVYQMERIGMAKQIDYFVVATSVEPQDDAIESCCKEYNLPCFRGSETDVLSRYFECARHNQADIVIRLTADCPLIDPNVVDLVILEHEKQGVDYCANTIPFETSTFPDGSDVEVFTIKALERAHKEAKNFEDREHVTFYFWKYDHGFLTAQYQGERNISHYRITVDYPEDLEVISYIIHELQRRKLFGYINEVISILCENDTVRLYNQAYSFGQGWEQ